MKFIPYVYIPFSQNFDEKSYISAKIEAVKRFSSYWGTAPTSNQIVESYGLNDVAWLDVVIGI